MAFFISKILQRFPFGFLPKAIPVFTILIVFPSLLFSNCIVSCVQSFNLSLGVEGYYQATPEDLLVDQDCDPLNFHVIVFDENGQAIGDTIDCAQIGQTVSAVVYETATGNSCATNIQVFDNLPPTINCQDTMLLCGLNYDPNTLGFPLVFDNCTELDSTDLNYDDDITNYDCLEIINGDTLNAIIQRTWSVVDDQGNTRVCIQEIKLKKSSVWDAQFPPDRNDLMEPSLDCSEDPYDLSLTGEPTIQGIPVSQGTFCDLIVSHNDNQVPHCGANSFAIIRAWTIIDWCTGAFRNHNQIIKVVDQTPPQINCPADLTVYTNVYDCFGFVSLLPGTATDDCSTVTVTPSWEFGSGAGPFENVPIGTYAVTYTAEDACGNSSTCQIMVTMMDNSPPISICNSSAQFNLGLDGTVKVFPNIFNDGTYDNCGISHFEIARVGDVFSDSLILTCEDLNSNPVQLEVRAWDIHNNYNDCSVEVQLNDKLDPIINCPDDLTINCQDDYLDLLITGSPGTFDNCGIDTIYFTDTESLNACNVGEIARTWVVEDHSGHQTSCVQYITLVDLDTLIVQFPANINLNNCGVQLDTSLTGSPIIQNKNCELLSITFSDDTLVQVLPACYVVTRHWQIHDWCNYDPVTLEGYWSAHQIITVSDETDPVLIIPNDTTLFHQSDTCGLYYFELPTVSATDCSAQISIINNSGYAIQNGANASGWYPPGTHTIQFYAEDGCGNTSTGNYQITVLDGKAPTAVCNAGLHFELGLNGEVNITPEDIDDESFDNCTAQENLLFTIYPSFFTCDNLGPNTVELTVKDEAGLSSTCTTTIYVQDNQGVCPGGTIIGQINDWHGGGVNNVKVLFTGAAQDTIFTNAAGEFSKGQLEVGQNIVVKPSKDSLVRNGLSTLDVVLISRHIISLDPLVNPYQMLAADVDRDGFITSFDMIYIQRIILFMDDAFANSKSWRFSPADHVFNNPLNPFLNEPQELMAINNIPDAEIDVEFIGMKVGDVSGNSNPGLAMNSSMPEELNLELKVSDDGFRIELSEEQPVELFGMQFTIPAVCNEETLVNYTGTEGELSYHYEEEKELLHIMISSPTEIMLDIENVFIEIDHVVPTNKTLDLCELQGGYVRQDLTEQKMMINVTQSVELADVKTLTNRQID